MMLDNGAFFKREGNLQHIAASSSSANPLNTPLQAADCPPSVRELFPLTPKSTKSGEGCSAQLWNLLGNVGVGDENLSSAATVNNAGCYWIQWSPTFEAR